MRLLPGALGGRRGESIALLLLAVLAIAAGTATPLYADAADRRAIEAELAAATPTERSITLQTPIFEGHPDVILQNLQARARAVLHQPKLTEVTGAYAEGIAGAALVARSDVCRHLGFEGACPSSAGEVLAPEGPIGRTITQGDLTLKVVGVYRPDGAATDPYWAGRSALTPMPQRPANPLFTALPTFTSPEVGSAMATYDLIAGPGSLTPQSLPPLSSVLESNLDFGFNVQSSQGLRYLVRRITATRHDLAASLPLGAVESLLLCWFVLLLTITYGTVRRRTETALALLRAAPTRYRAVLVLGPMTTLLLLAAPLGFGLGWLGARWLGGATTVTPLAVAGGAGTLLAVLVTGAIAAWRAQAVPLVDALRQVPSRSSRGVLIAEAVVAVVALAAVAQALVQPGSGLALLAPIASAIVAGLLMARLVRYAAGHLGAALLDRGRLGSGLAVLQLARRPGADRLVALMVVTVALAGHAISAWDASVVHARSEALAQLGSVRVLSVTAASRPALLDAVRRADPDSRWALAAARYHNGAAEIVGVDSARLDSVLGRAGLADRLRPQSFEPIRVTTAKLPIDFDVREALLGPMPVTVALTGPRGEQVKATVEIAAGSGARPVVAAVPVCATAPGCRLGWISFGRTPSGIWVRRVGDLTGPALCLAARWRKSLDAGADTTVLIGPGEVSVRYAPTDVRVRSNDIRLTVADAPIPLPVVAAGDESIVHNGELRAQVLFSGTERPIQVVAAEPLVPGVGANGILVDLDLADRLTDSQDNAASLEVWLNGSAPADAEDRLRAAGLIVLGHESLAQRSDSLRARSDAGATNLRLAGSILGVLLAALAVAVVAAGDRRRRVEELAALRVQGVTRPVAARAIGGYGLMAAIAFPAGLVVAFLTWDLGDPHPQASPRPPVVLGFLAGVALVLAITAIVARRTLAAGLPRDSAGLPRDSAGLARDSATTTAAEKAVPGEEAQAGNGGVS